MFTNASTGAYLSCKPYEILYVQPEVCAKVENVFPHESEKPDVGSVNIMQSRNNADFLVVEPNIEEHNVFKLTPYSEAYEKADIVVFLTAHKEFMQLEWRDDKVILDFCGIFKK